MVTPSTRSTANCYERRSGNPEPAPLERPRTQRSAITVGQIVDGSPADVAAAWAFGVGLPQRGALSLSLPVTAAAEALDHEWLHRPIVLGRGTEASPGRVIGQGLSVAAHASWESGPLPVHASATRPAVESMPM